MYKIASYLLYDNQLHPKYVLLHNDINLPYIVRSALNVVGHMNQENIATHIKNACDSALTPFIKLEEEYILFSKISKTHMDIYNGYDIYWNEEVSGVNVHEYNYMSVINKTGGLGTNGINTSQYYIHEFKANRIKWAREKSFKLLNV